MRNYLNGRNLNYNLAKQNHWYATRFTNDMYARVAIPATSHLLNNVYWQARAMDEGVEPKYDSPFAPRGDAVILVWPTKPRTPVETVVVEGPMDALAAAGEGYIGLALMGVTPGIVVLDLTARLIHGTMCSIVADNDELAAMTQVLLYLVSRRSNVRLISPHPYKDLAEAPPEARRNILGAYARPACP